MEAHCLPPRQQQIAALLIEGRSNKDIADCLQITTRTVKAHFNRMFIRFQIRDGAKRVKLATTVRNGAGIFANPSARQLTRNELGVAEKVAAGWHNAAIAQSMSCSENNVKQFLRNIFNKLGIDNRVELALWHCARNQ